MFNRVGQALRMAGDRVKSFDDAYVDRLLTVIQGNDPSKIGPVKAVMSVAAGSPLSAMGKMAKLEGNVSATDRLIAGAANYGLPVASAGVRYGLPLAGLKLAADGIGAVYDAASQTPVFGANPADDQSNLMVTYVR